MESNHCQLAIYFFIVVVLKFQCHIGFFREIISKMKSGKATGPSGIVVEMIKAAGDTGATMIRDLATTIIRDGKVPTDWEESFIVCLYKGKGDALDRGNY